MPWQQRGTEPPEVNVAEKHRRLLREAAEELETAGFRATVERLADKLDLSPRTVRRWRQEMAP